MTMLQDGGKCGWERTYSSSNETWSIPGILIPSGMNFRLSFFLPYSSAEHKCLPFFGAAVGLHL